MKVDPRRGIVRSARWVLIAVLAGWTAWPQAAQQGAGTTPQKRQRLNTIIQALEEGKVADLSVKVSIEMEHQPYDIIGLRKQFAEIAAKRKPNGQVEKTPIVRLPTR